MQLRELPLDKSDPDREAVEQWWNGLKDRPELMGTSATFGEAFWDLKEHTDFPNSGKYGWGAYDSTGILCGFITGQIDKETPSSMGFVYLVNPHRWGCGIGTAMLQELVRDETFGHFETFRCTVFPGNRVSRKVMEEVGFVEDIRDGKSYTYTRCQ